MDSKTIGAVAALAILAFAGFAYAAPAWQQNAGYGRGMMGASLNTTEHEAFETAVESGDFAAAKTLHEQYGFGGRMFDSLDATSFAKFSQMHKAMEAGDYAAADSIRAELRETGGFGMGRGMGAGRQAGSGRGMRGNCPHATGN